MKIAAQGLLSLARLTPLHDHELAVLVVFGADQHRCVLHRASIVAATIFRNVAHNLRQEQFVFVLCWLVFGRLLVRLAA